MSTQTEPPPAEARLQLDLQIADSCAQIPDRLTLERYLQAALDERPLPSSLTLRVVGSNESCALNHEFRSIARPTNVLAFPSTGLEEIFPEFLGDIVVCGPRVTEEAAEQGKSVEAHWAHLVVHGALHLLGYDHIETDDAARMEELERKLLAGLGFPDPYAQ
jgi:probable rRNA maturation factor